MHLNAPGVCLRTSTEPRGSCIFGADRRIDQQHWPQQEQSIDHDGAQEAWWGGCAISGVLTVWRRCSRLVTGICPKRQRVIVCLRSAPNSNNSCEKHLFRAVVKNVESYQLKLMLEGGFIQRFVTNINMTSFRLKMLDDSAVGRVPGQLVLHLGRTCGVFVYWELLVTSVQSIPSTVNRLERSVGRWRLQKVCLCWPQAVVSWFNDSRSS